MRRYLVLLALLSTSAHAGESHVLKGVFCNTQSQVVTVMDTVSNTVTLDEAIEVQNASSVECSYAGAIKMMIVRPIRHGTGRSNGMTYNIYEGTLVGVLVGNDPRPVTPTTQTFFVRIERLEGEAVGL